MRSYFVQFKAQGANEVIQGLSAIKAKVDAASAALNAFKISDDVRLSIRRAQEAQDNLEKSARRLTIVFGSLSAGLGLFIRSGLSGTIEGERLSLRFEMLSRQITALFLPALDTLTRTLERIVGWFRSLSGDQQNVLGTTALLAVGAVGLALAFAQVGKAITSLIALYKALNVVQTINLALSGNPAAIGKAIVGVAAVGGLAYLINQISSSFSSTGGTRRDVTPVGGGFEQVQDTFRRIQLAAVKQAVEVDIPKQQLQEQRITNHILQKIELKSASKLPFLQDLFFGFPG